MKTMHDFLNHLLDKAENGETAVIIQFKSPTPPVQGALRRAKEVEGMFELLAIAQTGQNGQPLPISNYFFSDEVSRVMVIREDMMSSLVKPKNSGLVIPT